MRNIIIYLLTCFLIYQSDSFSMQVDMGSTPTKAEKKEYEGFISDQVIRNVRVKPCITLGTSCTAQIAKLIKGSNQFVVAFMYRFDSPQIIHELSDLYSNTKTTRHSVPVMLFLDYQQASTISATNQLVSRVPATYVKFGTYNFHQKVMICKKRGQKAYVIIGSANATGDSDTSHSEDSLIIQSNILAKIILSQYHQLLIRTESKEQKEIFHVHRLESQKSNTEQLLIFKSIIERGESEDKYDPDNKGLFYKSDIVTFAMSSPLSSVGQQSCLKALNMDLERAQGATKELILFQDFFTFNSAAKGFQDRPLGILINKFMEIIENNNFSKLIVLNNDKAQEQRETNTNAATVSSLNNKHKITALLTKPYTGGLFHHKLMIQYFKNPTAIPIIYTGSFNLSNSALNKNSETIIGIASKEIAELYLASIIDQSGLWAEIEVWKFLAKGAPEHFHFHLLENIALKYFKSTKDNMNHYTDRYEKIIGILPMPPQAKFDCTRLLSYFDKEQPLGKSNTLKKIKAIIYSHDSFEAIFKKIRELLGNEILAPLKLQLNAEIITDTERLEDLKKIIETGKTKVTASRKRDALESDKIPKVNKVDEIIKEIEEIYHLLIAVDEYIVEFEQSKRLNDAITNYLGEHPALHSTTSMEIDYSDSEEEIDIKSLSIQERASVVEIRKFLKYLIEHEYELSDIAVNTLHGSLTEKTIDGYIKEALAIGLGAHHFMDILKSKYPKDYRSWKEEGEGEGEEYIEPKK